MSAKQIQPIRYVRAGQLPPTDIPQLHRVDADQLQPGGIYFSEPPPHISTPESRQERASVWRLVVLPTAIVTASVLAALVISVYRT